MLQLFKVLDMAKNERHKDWGRGSILLTNPIIVGLDSLNIQIVFHFYYCNQKVSFKYFHEISSCVRVLQTTQFGRK